MKRILLIALLTLVICGQVGATDIRVVLVDSIVAADTAITSTRADTVYSSAMRLEYFRFLQFYSKAVPFSNFADTNWATDTFFVDFQTSENRIHWVTHEIDTFLTTDSSYSPLNLDCDATVFGNWGRIRFIHWDSMETTQPGLFENAYRKELELWVIPKK